MYMSLADSLVHEGFRAGTSGSTITVEMMVVACP